MSRDQLSNILFDNTTYEDLLRDIYHDTKKKDLQIDLLVSTLKDIIKSKSDALDLGPIIGQFLDISVKNKDHLIKLATIVSRSKIKIIRSIPQEDELNFLNSKEEWIKELQQSVEKIPQIEGV